MESPCVTEPSTKVVSATDREAVKAPVTQRENRHPVVLVVPVGVSLVAPVLVEVPVFELFRVEVPPHLPPTDTIYNMKWEKKL